MKRIQEPNNTVINHSLHSFADITGQYYRAVVLWFIGFFSWLDNVYEGGFSPEGGNYPVFQNIFEYFQKVLGYSHFLVI